MNKGCTVELDREKLKTLVTWVANNLKSLESELMAYQTALTVFRAGFPQQGAVFDLMLEKSRQHPPLLDHMRQKYEETLRLLLEQISQDQADEQAFLKALQLWQTNKGPIN